MKLSKQKRELSWLFCSAAAVGLAGCGGGGGGGTTAALPADAVTATLPAAAADTTVATADAAQLGIPTARSLDLVAARRDARDTKDEINASGAVLPGARGGRDRVDASGAVLPGAPVVDASPVAPAPAPVVDVSVAAPIVAAPAPVTVAAAPAPAASPAPATVAQAPSPVFADCEMFPANNIFNTRIDGLPAHPNSWNWINMVGGSTPFMPNWGNSSDPSHTWDYWGIPINVVDSSQLLWPVINYDGGYPHRSDCATSPGGSIIHDCSNQPAESRRWAVPSGTVLTEGNDDKHVLVVDRSNCRLWESFAAHNYGNGQWNAVTTATWDLRSNAMRPIDTVSADAAGLPIAPLLAKASEAATGEIRHAMRVTFRNQFMSVKYNWPARTGIGLENDGNIPFGSLLRLRADFVIPDNWSPQAKAVANAFKRYGLYVADNGQDFFVQGEPSDGWDPVAWQQLRTLSLGNMEFVDTSPITRHPNFNPNSMQASW